MGLMTRSSVTSLIADRSRVSADRARARAEKPATEREAIAARTPNATPPSSRIAGNARPRHLRSVRHVHLEVAHHRQRGQPSRRRQPRRGRRPLQQPDQPPPDRGARDAEVGRADRLVERVVQVAEPGDRRTAYGFGPRRCELGRDVVRDAAHGRVDPGSLDGAGLGQRRPCARGELPAFRAEVEVKPLERVRPEPAEPLGQRPPGRLRGTLLGRLLDGAHDGGHARGVCERLDQLGLAATRHVTRLGGAVDVLRGAPPRPSRRRGAGRAWPAWLARAMRPPA